MVWPRAIPWIPSIDNVSSVPLPDDADYWRGRAAMLQRNLDAVVRRNSSLVEPSALKLSRDSLRKWQGLALIGAFCNALLWLQVAMRCP